LDKILVKIARGPLSNFGIKLDRQRVKAFGYSCFVTIHSRYMRVKCGTALMGKNVDAIPLLRYVPTPLCHNKCSKRMPFAFTHYF